MAMGGEACRVGGPAASFGCSHYKVSVFQRDEGATRHKVLTNDALIMTSVILMTPDGSEWCV